jgi:hypothetical protein
VHLAPLVRASHERFDGNGYPDGLAGEEIPLGARIIAVCDAFHAMTSARPYSRARRIDDALAELLRCAGTQFDPAVVPAFRAALTEPGRPRSGGRAFAAVAYARRARTGCGAKSSAPSRSSSSAGPRIAASASMLSDTDRS